VPFAVRTASSDAGPVPSMNDLLRGKGSIACRSVR